MAYLSIDIETTGLDPDSHDILELGVVYDDLKSDWRELPSFECLIEQDDDYMGQPFALALNQGIFWELAGFNRDGSEIAENQITTAPPIIKEHMVAEAFVHWLEEVSGVSNTEWDRWTIAGKNYSTFDRNFLSALPYFNESVPCHHRAIDPGNLYWDHTQDGMRLPNMETCFERAAIHKTVSHRAVADALDVVRLVRIHMFGHDHAIGVPE